MRKIDVLFAVGLIGALTVACKSASTAEPEPGTVQPRAVDDDQRSSAREDADDPSTKRAAMTRTLRFLEDLGYTQQRVDEIHTLVCNSTRDRCVCIRPLACVAAGNCPSLESATGTFLAALNRPQQGVRVHCDHAGVGRCGSSHYFSFQGDIGRDETQWFDESRRLIATSFSTDYAAYCDGASRVLISGDLPECDLATGTKLLCGEARPVQPPLQSVRASLKSPLTPE